MQSIATGAISAPFVSAGLNLSLTFKHAQDHQRTYQLGSKEIVLNQPEGFNPAELTPSAFRVLMLDDTNVQTVAAAMLAQSPTS